MPYGNVPGGGQNFRLAQLLARQNGTVNNGSHAGGMAHALQQGLMGLMMKRDMDETAKAKEDEAAASQALIKGMSPQQMPEGVYGPPQAGGIDQAIQQLGSLPGNQSAGRLSQALLMKKAERDMAPETFGAPTGVIGPDKTPTLVQFGNRGGQRQVEGGYEPSPKSMADGMPSSVQEWQYFSNLPKDQQDAYLTMKRAQPWLNMGGTQMLPSQANPAGPARAEVAKTVPPEDTPENRGAQRGAVIAAEQQGDQNKKATQGKTVLDLLDLAEGKVPGPQGPMPDLLQNATGSGAGAMMDATAGFFGATPRGAAEAQKLGVLGGQLIMMMPRMEGPQSNYDQQLYREMAGQIGDPSTPPERKKAAADTLRALHSKYAGQQQGAPQAQPAPGAIKFLGFE
jgi:hypothetical protein